MISGNYAALYRQLKQTIPEERLIHDDLRLLAFGTDASFYRLIPRLVVKVHNEAEAQQVIRHCRDLELPLTIRAAGTSLSGQAISDSVLMLVVSTEWRHFSIGADQETITVQPGVIGGQANRYLSEHHKKIGPDPASINSAQIGGIVANNASGMSSGIRGNSYYTLAGIRIILADGTLLDTRDEQSRSRFLKDKKEIVDKISALARSAKENPAVRDRITQKFEIKNTTGYAVNALIDFEDPLDIIAHLMVGSEGTLGFVSEITLQTLDDPPHKATSLALFPDIATACKSIALLKNCCVAAAELMDRNSLRSVENKDMMPEYLKTLDENVTALLIETRAADQEKLNRQIKEITEALKSVEMVLPVTFTKDPKAINALWSVRKGLFPSVCANRKTGTTVIIEDIAVPYVNLAPALLELKQLFAEYNYADAIIWGHAFDGNVHFVLIQDFDDPSELQRYENFIDKLVTMVVDKYNGSLKAEHGTGRNMAPFVEKEWGSEIYRIMKEIKVILDPQNILNPGVLLNEDARLHLKNLKPMPEAHALIDDCIECGFCEVNCVSRDLTLTPRQRIVAYREMTQLKRSGHEPHRLAQLNSAYDYQGNQTCATDGLCALSCPVDIDTGKLIKELRHDQTSDRAKRIAGWLADNMDRVTAMARFGLGLVHLFHRLLGPQVMTGISGAVRKLSGNRVPRWNPFMPGSSLAAHPKSSNGSNAPKVVYFSSCITRSMGASPDYDEQIALTRKTEQLLQKAGYEIIYPQNINALCCGMAYASKGFKEAGDRKAQELNAALLQATNQGEYPVLADMSPCLYRMKETLSPQLSLFEPIEFTLTHLAPRLDFNPVDEPIAIHTVCSAKKMDLEESFMKLARMCARDVVAPQTTCCGFAGDRGFTFPELNESGLKLLREQIPQDCRHGYSTSRTCEIGLSEHSGISFKSILYLVDRCTSAKQPANS